MIKTNETTDKINQCIQDDFFKCYMRSQPKDRIIEFLDIKNKLESFHIFKLKDILKNAGYIFSEGVASVYIFQWIIFGIPLLSVFQLNGW